MEKIKSIKRKIDDPNFSGYLYFFYDDRDPTSDDDAYINSIGFTVPSIIYWWNQTTNTLSFLTNWGTTPLIWQQLVFDANILAILLAEGWLVNTPRNYNNSEITLNESRQPNVTNDTFVVASINLINELLTTTTVLVQVSPDDSTWDTIYTLEDMTGVVSNKTLPIGFPVPAGYYYQFVTSGTGTISLVSCMELSN